MGRDKDKPKPDPADEFLSAMRDVTPLKAKSRISKYRPTTKIRPKFTEEDNRAVLAESLELDTSAWDQETLHFQGPGIQNQTMRKLKRGAYRIDDELDLHGCTAREASELIGRFIDDCRAADMRCVRIVHGKGNRSLKGPVIKPLVATWLERRKDVLAFATARLEDGGTGALYVLLAANAA